MRASEAGRWGSCVTAGLSVADGKAALVWHLLLCVEPVPEETWKPDSTTRVVMGPRLAAGPFTTRFLILVLYAYYRSQIFPRVNLFLTAEISSPSS